MRDMGVPQPGDSSYSAPGPPWWRTRFWSMSTWIIAVNIAVFIIDVLAFGRLTHYGALSGYGIHHVHIWQLFTYQFLHDGPWHLIFNMVWLYFMGPMVEWRFGKHRFLLFYLVCGMVGGACFLLQWYLRERFRGQDSSMVGASAAVFGVMAAAVNLAPGMTIRMWFPPIALTLRALFWIMVGLAAVTVYTGGFNNGGEAAHLGGAAMGAILIRNVQWLRLAQGPRRQRFWNPADPSTSFFRNDI